MSDVAGAIDTAEQEARDELAAIRSELEALAQRASRARSDCGRLTALREQAKALESAIRTASESVAPTRGRDPDERAGEQVDSEHARQVIEMRREGA